MRHLIKNNPTMSRYLLALVVLMVAPLSVMNATTAVVKTSDGELHGLEGRSVQSFLGIPFAKPPVGELRWKSPSEPIPWTGVREAAKLPRGCAAQVSGDGVRNENEDCLYLDLYRPNGATGGEKLPVMVFFHGGANLWGSVAIYDGLRMAAVAKAIVIMPLYRLGVMGLLALPEMGDSAGDLMLEDQIAALKWVKKHVSDFGGDPNDVTLSGESAGSLDICSLLASPAAKGLFHQAILQSSPCRNGPTKQQAIERTDKLAAALHCEGPSKIICLKQQGSGRLIDAWSSLAAPQGNVSAHGGALLTAGEADAIGHGRFEHVPLLIGFTQNELWSMQHHFVPLDIAGLHKQFIKSFGSNADAAATEYRPAEFAHLEYALGAALGDSMMVCPSYIFADQAVKWTRVSMYEFADASVPPFKPLGAGAARPTGYSPGATHTAELQYLYAYQAAEGPLNQTQSHLADEMVTAWVAFGRGKDSWPPYLPSKPTTTVIGSESGAFVFSDEVAKRHHCNFWNSVAQEKP